MPQLDPPILTRQTGTPDDTRTSRSHMDFGDELHRKVARPGPTQVHAEPHHASHGAHAATAVVEPELDGDAEAEATRVVVSGFAHRSCQ